MRSRYKRRSGGTQSTPTTLATSGSGRASPRSEPGSPASPDDDAPNSVVIALPHQRWVISKRPAHAALVSEADFIASQDTAVPRGPAGPAARRYLLAGLLACGRCGRRLESAWSNGRAAYRCRHGHASAARPDPGRPKNTYVREDQIPPHLAALAILQAGDGGPGDAGTVQIAAPTKSADLIDQLRASGIVLTYDPDTCTIRMGDPDPVAVTTGRDH
jgi:hypothetical protein